MTEETLKFKMCCVCDFEERIQGYSEIGLFFPSLNGLELIKIGDIINDYHAATEKYVIKYDGHPNSRAAAIVGDFLAKKLTETMYKSKAGYKSAQAGIMEK